MPKPRRNFPKAAQMFYCIGAQKAGTTWLYDHLSQSEDVHFSRNKELHYFDVIAGQADLAMELRIDMVKSLANKLKLNTGKSNKFTLIRLREMSELLQIYTGGPGRHTPYLTYLLKDWDGAKVVGDITPSYSILDRASFADMAGIGDAKFLFILRDPVARMWSQIRMSFASKGLPEDEFRQGCLDHADILIKNKRLEKLGRANYKRTITELEAVIPAERILYVFYEDLFEQATSDKITTFLGIPPIFADQNRKVNEGMSFTIPPEILTQFRAHLDPEYVFAQERFGAALPQAWSRYEAPPQGFLTRLGL